MLFLLLLALLLVPAGNLRADSRPLDIYWIDTEGGAATLLVSPSGESFLIDTGWTVGDRDAKRIYPATQLAGLKKLRPAHDLGSLEPRISIFSIAGGFEKSSGACAIRALAMGPFR